ncbi:hypothetical protein N7476_004965 [Penicillium atrosanguineum]|uniref:Uncharacterized protein n=1 Tax=Penicillium atrosanguineum TaxID=1132637 RepID=A0A9W9Q0C3_9EURO|nr:hypothetical protein N7526_001959 [Penicillium atrosanguineum]KAJ5318545.1 hypothetical protein N7476_004965 [Penicillium atrosanguineum]
MPYYLVISSTYRQVECYEGVPSENVNRIKEFIRSNEGESLEEFEGCNGFRGCKYLSVLYTSQHYISLLCIHSALNETSWFTLRSICWRRINYLQGKEAPAHPGLDDVVSLEKMCLIRHPASKPHDFDNHLVRPLPCRHYFSSSLARILHEVRNADFRVVIESSNRVTYASPCIQEWTRGPGEGTMHSALRKSPISPESNSLIAFNLEQGTLFKFRGVNWLASKEEDKLKDAQMKARHALGRRQFEPLSSYRAFQCQKCRVRFSAS